MNKTHKVKIGEVGVDAGLIWIGDPCYFLHADPMPKELGKSWDEFCDTLHPDKQNSEPFRYKSFNFDMGHEGLGVVVETGYGDGCYDVIAEISDEGAGGQRVKSITVKFF